MQCRECGHSLDAPTLLCPACGSPVVSETDPAPIRPAAVPKPMYLQVGDLFARRYQVVKYLGEGCLCRTYLCLDSHAGKREVVLKILFEHKAEEPDLIEAFLFLAQAVAEYHHKGIAKIHEAGTWDGAAYLVMESIAGSPLRLWLLERPVFENRAAAGLGIVKSLLEIFRAVHQRGCYGCLKSENVFITPGGPVIADFGSAGFLSPREFEFNAHARRYLPYMAPELKRDWSNLIPASDFYSLGALLYEILSGREPTFPPRPLSEGNEYFRVEADKVIRRAMAGNPSDRFAAPEDFLAAVSAVQGLLMATHSRPVPPQPASRPTVEKPAMEKKPTVAHSPLDITSDRSAIHNPEETSFSLTVDTARSKDSEAPKPNKMGGEAFPEPGAGGKADPGSDGEASEMMDEAESGQHWTHQERAHYDRRFVHPQESALSESLGTEKEAGGAEPSIVSGAPKKRPGRVVREKSDDVEPPMPKWVWFLLAVVGTALVAFSAYLGVFTGR